MEQPKHFIQEANKIYLFILAMETPPVKFVTFNTLNEFKLKSVKYKLHNKLKIPPAVQKHPCATSVHVKTIHGCVGLRMNVVDTTTRVLSHELMPPDDLHELG